MRKNLQEAAFNQMLSRLEARDIPDEDRNEVQIFFVKVALGGAYALDGIVDLTSKKLGLPHASKLGEAALSIEDAVGLQQVERIILHWTLALATGKTIDDRWRELIAEWCIQRMEISVRGRPQDSPVKRFAVITRLIELAEKYPEYSRGAKKQIYSDLQGHFGLKRSQLIKLIDGFDPWEFLKNHASGKSD
jgi:hypothetical protein